MIRFIRIILLYIVFFIAMALVGQWLYPMFFAKDSHDVVAPPVLMSFDAIQDKIQRRMTIRETNTGLLLAGLSAQNRRDWGYAGQNFAALSNRLEGRNVALDLKAMTLALGNGAFADVERINAKIRQEIKGDGTDDDVLMSDVESLDLVYLFSALQALKNNDFLTVKQMMSRLDKGAVKEFSVPIIRAWMMAEDETQDFQLGKQDLTPMQGYYVALAAEYAGNDKVAMDIMTAIHIKELPMMMGIGKIQFLRRHNMTEEADKSLELAKDIYANVPLFYDLVGQATDKDLSEVIKRPYDNASDALSACFRDFANVMYAEQSVDSSLLFARMAQYLDPDTPSLGYLIARIFMSQDQKVNAQKALDDLKFSDPVFSMAARLKVSLFLDDNRIDDAMHFVDTIFPKDDALEDLSKALKYNLMANIYYEDKEYQKAIDAYNLVEQYGRDEEGVITPEFKAIYYARGVAYDLLGDWDQAEKDLLHAIELIPNSPTILNYIGYAYADRGINLDKAIDYITQAVMYAPNDAFIIDSMGWALYKMGQYDRALDILERAASLAPYHMVINDHLGDVYWRIGRTIEAHYMWQRARDYYDETDEEQREMIEETRRKIKYGLDSGQD